MSPYSILRSTVLRQYSRYYLLYFSFYLFTLVYAQWKTSGRKEKKENMGGQKMENPCLELSNNSLHQ